MVLDFLKKQFVDVIDWVDEPGVLAIRYPMRDREIQNGAPAHGAREPDGRVHQRRAGSPTCSARGSTRSRPRPCRSSPILMNWDKALRLAVQVGRLLLLAARADQPQMGHDPAGHDPRQGVRRRSGSARSAAIRSASTMSRPFSVKLMGTLERLRVEDIEPQLRAAIATALATGLGGGDVPFLDLAANQTLLSEKLKEAVDAGAWRNGASRCPASSSRACRCPKRCRGISTRQARCG